MINALSINVVSVELIVKPAQFFWSHTVPSGTMFTYGDGIYMKIWHEQLGYMAVHLATGQIIRESSFQRGNIEPITTSVTIKPREKSE